MDIIGRLSVSKSMKMLNYVANRQGHGNVPVDPVFRLRQEDCLNPRVQDQPGQPGETPSTYSLILFSPFSFKERVSLCSSGQS